MSNTFLRRVNVLLQISTLGHLHCHLQKRTHFYRFEWLHHDADLGYFIYQLLMKSIIVVVYNFLHLGFHNAFKHAHDVAHIFHGLPIRTKNIIYIIVLVRKLQACHPKVQWHVFETSHPCKRLIATFFSSNEFPSRIRHGSPCKLFHASS